MKTFETIVLIILLPFILLISVGEIISDYIVKMFNKYIFL